MKFTGAAALFAAVASAITVSYDEGYDNADRDLSIVACSDGPKGLRSTYPTQGSIPGFPNIGGSADISGWGSDQCGACYKVTFDNRSIFIVAIDSAGAGLNLSKRAMDTLTGGRAQERGRIDAQVERVTVNNCGLSTNPKRSIEFMA